MKVHEFLTDPEKWTQGSFAKDASGNPVLLDKPEACQWCLSGLIRICYDGERDFVDVRNKILKHLRTITGMGIIAWNDYPTRTFEDVKQLVEELDV